MGCPPDCAFCAGTACAPCMDDARSSPVLAISAHCPHRDPVERHQGMQMIAQSRIATRELPPVEIALTDELKITVDDGEGFAKALEEIARRVRIRGWVIIK